MSEFSAALQEKIAALENERQGLEASLAQIDAQIEVLRELFPDEVGDSPTPRRRGRPKGAKNKVKKMASAKKKVVTSEEDELYKEAVSLGGEDAKTDPELAERIKSRFKPTPRVRDGYGPGVKAGTKQDVLGTGEAIADATISIDDETTDREITDV